MVTLRLDFVLKTYYFARLIKSNTMDFVDIARRLGVSLERTSAGRFFVITRVSRFDYWPDVRCINSVLPSANSSHFCLFGWPAPSRAGAISW